MCHVLIIEDDPFVSMHLSLLAEDAGATSIGTADTESEAVTAARDRRPDVILSDVRLIEGTGPRAVARIYTDCGPIPVIFVTGTPEECEPCHYAEAVLGKPVNDRALKSAFARVAP
ncbi:MAG: response regulator [Oxalobacteraceae bacterium]|nr:MAG: response regulator [Oxalobacteraceae bacterium]